MKKVLGVLLAFWAFANASFGQTVLPLAGTWQFYKMVINNQEMPPRDPRLVLQFEFRAPDFDRLSWTYDEGKTLCERQGQFKIVEASLVDKVVWVNPNNRSDCGSDPDMQLARETFTPFVLENGELKLSLPFGGQSLIYIWKKVTN